MKIIFRYIRPYLAITALAIALLAGQAFGELSLPDMMSDIVNIGLQGGGIEEDYPKQLTSRSMDLLAACMAPEEAELFLSAYEDGRCVDNGNPGLAEIYGRAAYRLANPGAGNLEPDSMLYQQMSKAMIPMFYQEAGLDTQKLQKDYIYKTGGLMLLLAMANGLAAVFVSLLSSRVSAGLSRDMRRAVFSKVQSFSKAEIDKFSTASLITRSTNDVQQVQQFVLMGIRMMVFAPVMGFGGLVMAIRKSPGLSWIIALIIGILLVMLAVALKTVLPRFKILQTFIDKLNLVSRENLTGLMVIRAFGNERHEEGRFDAAAKDLARTERYVYRAMSIMMPMLFLLMNAMSMMIIWFGGRAIERSALQIGDMMAFVQYAMHIIFSFVFLAMMFVMLPRASVSANRIKELLDTEATILDAEKPVSYPNGPSTVTFDKVYFRYGGAEDDVLSGISFTARPGETTAFIGATGAGKTTLMHLLERFYDVTAGTIAVNGVDIRQIPQARLRSEIGFVPQSAVLFSGDIRSNIAYGAESIAEELVRKAVEVAQAADFVAEAAEGLEAQVAQGGSNFSGGQKQRLSIARALARQPRIYIFDDSFSALDFQTDAALRRALKETTAGATVFIVAQRVSTIMNAEQIVVLEEGRVAGIGTHKELLQACEVYREIAESQLSKEELNA
ncbi:MAG: ABC transporter ATP-binding protein/permease [Oscillospiraceae bacterium]|nr:ABC transporter ATP-binding protein/permease [Oscillospiraceae bacterium]